VADGSIVARERELEAISAFLDLRAAEGRALVLEGEAGIGKTTLWRRAARAASEAGCSVLVTRPSAAEAGFAFSGLDDLLGGWLGGIGASVPAPQMTALEIALLRREAEGPPSDPRVIAAGVLSALRALATQAAVVVAVDDVHWLDRESAAALAYAFRRLDAHPVRLVASLRLDPALPASELLGAIPPELTRVRVGPLSAGALHRAIRIHLGRTLPRPVLLRVHQLSGGNPFYALELARSLPDEPRRGFALPPTLERVTHARLERLAAPVRRILEPAALLANPTASVLERLGDDAKQVGEHLDRAVQAGVIEIEADRVRFTHPLLAEGMAAMIGPRRRHRLHLRLAELVSDPEERARHLALATALPNAEVAQALDEAAAHSRARGAPDAAAELAELARELTPPGEESALRTRGLGAAQYHFDAGDATRAATVLRDVIAASPPGPDRAELLYRLSMMSWMNLLHGVRDPALQALQEAGDDRALRSGIHAALGWVEFYLADLDAAADHAHSAVEEINQVADPAARADALATLGLVEFARGRPSESFMAEAIQYQDAMMATGSWTEASVYTTPRSILGLELMWSGRLDEARRSLEQELAEYEKHAMYTVRQEVLCYLSEAESRAGRWSLAARYAADAMETVVEAGQTATQRHVALFTQSLAAAHLGQVDDARHMAIDGVRLALSNDDPFYANSTRAVLGFLELSLSNFEQARAHLDPVVAYLGRMGAAEPGIIPCLPDQVETLISLGRADEAEPLVDRLEEQGRALDRSWALATASRCRGLIAAARRDLDGSRDALERSVVEHGRVPQPFERGRTLLALGSTLRRLRRMKDARETLHRALTTFDELGAPLWAAKARSELARIGGRTSAGDELTTTERRIAELVAEGKTNKEVAAILVVADRTVESALTQIYRKLDVRSRTELARKLSSTV
jgi:DNA-binding CsgD family transcriptional regulator